MYCISQLLSNFDSVSHKLPHKSKNVSAKLKPIWQLLTESWKPTVEASVNSSWARILENRSFKNLQQEDFDSTNKALMLLLPLFIETLEWTGQPFARFNQQEVSPKHIKQGVDQKLMNEVLKAIVLSLDPRHLEYGNTWFIPQNNARFKKMYEESETPTGNKVRAALKYVLPALIDSLKKVGRSYVWFGLPDDGKSLSYLIRNGLYEARSTHCSHQDRIVYGVAKLKDGPWRLPPIKGLKQAAGIRVLVRDVQTRKKYALLSRKPNGSGRGASWSTPCGYMNAGEWPPEAIMRELSEEVSWNHDAILSKSTLYSSGHTHQTHYWPHLDDINYRMFVVWNVNDPSQLNLKPQTSLEKGVQVTELKEVRLFDVDNLPRSMTKATSDGINEAVQILNTGASIQHSVTSFGWGAHTKVDKYAPKLISNKNGQALCRL